VIALLATIVVLDLAGLVVSGVLFAEARRDVQAVYEAKVGDGRLLVARQAVRQEAARVVGFALLLFWAAATFLSLTIPPFPNSLLIARIAVGVCGLSLFYQTATMWRMRRRLFASARDAHDAHEAAQVDRSA